MVCCKIPSHCLRFFTFDVLTIHALAENRDFGVLTVLAIAVWMEEDIHLAVNLENNKSELSNADKEPK